MTDDRTSDQPANSPLGPSPHDQRPQVIYLPSPPNSLRQQLIAAVVTLGAAALGVYGVYLANSVADVRESVAEVHDLANSRLTELTEALAAANERIAELREIIGGMVPAPDEPEGDTQ